MKSILKKDRILVFVALLGLLASLVPLSRASSVIVR